MREGGREGGRERGRGRLDPVAIKDSMTCPHIKTAVFILYLKVPNLGSKLLSDMHVWECNIHARLHDSNRTGRKDKTLIVQPTHEHIHSLPHSTHHILSCV